MHRTAQETSQTLGLGKTRPLTGEKPRAMIAELSQFPVDLIQAVVMRGPDQRIHRLYGYAKKDGTVGQAPRAPTADGGDKGSFRNAIS